MKAYTVALGIVLDERGNEYITGNVPGPEEILNLGIN